MKVAVTSSGFSSQEHDKGSEQAIHGSTYMYIPVSTSKYRDVVWRNECYCYLLIHTRIIIFPSKEHYSAKRLWFVRI